MKLTKTQLNELLNQHTGTGYIILKTSSKNVHIADIGIGKQGHWFIGLDGKSLDKGLQGIAKEVIED